MRHHDVKNTLIFEKLSDMYVMFAPINSPNNFNTP